MGEVWGEDHGLIHLSISLCQAMQKDRGGCLCDGQYQVQVFRRPERQRHVFAPITKAEPGLPGIGLQSLRQEAQRYGVSAAGGEYLHQDREGNTRLQSQRESLGGGDHGRTPNEIVHQFHALSLSARSDVDDGSPDRLQVGADGPKAIHRTTDHNGQGSIACALIATGDWCVEKLRAVRLRLSGPVLCFVRRDGAVIDEPLPLTRGSERTGRTAENRLQRCTIGHADADHIGLVHHLGRRGHKAGPFLHQFVGTLGCAIGHHQLETSAQDVLGHGSSHDAKPDKADPHGRSIPLCTDALGGFAAAEARPPKSPRLPSCAEVEEADTVRWGKSGGLLAWGALQDSGVRRMDDD